MHNPTDTPISLLGYTLTDDPTQPTKWPLPVTTLAPGAFLVIWVSGLDQVTPEGWHTSFRLNRGGEYVGLFDPDGQLVDEVTFWEQEADVSLGRLGTVSDRWVPFLNPDARRGEYDPAPPAGTTGRAAGRDRAGERTLCRPGDGATLHAGTGQLAVLHAGWADPTVDGHEYTAPLEVTETTVLRVVALDDGVPVSAVTTATYLVGESTESAGALAGH